MDGGDGWTLLIESLETRLGKAEDRIDRLELWRNWAIGGGFVIGWLINTFGKHVVDLLQ